MYSLRHTQGIIPGEVGILLIHAAELYHISCALLALTTAAGLLQFLREEHLDVRVFAQS
jgi:hypothetical protein